MSMLDTYYRGFLDYRKITENDKTTKKDRKDIAKSEHTLMKFLITKYQVTIDESWVIEIERGLEYVEKAVKEERQFIRTNGEIVPIEKVKKVSRDSVSHLARHSEMITRKPEEGEDLVPDSIYMVEKLNDYAVYENRFLYLLLTYLRDFIELRVNKINDIRMTYICDFSLSTKVSSKKREVNYETNYHEDRKDNPYPIDNAHSKDILKRISDIAEIVSSLLKTNLMTEVSKSPMVKPPIVKTNVLKMNNNFKNSLALYEYIVNYKGLGYETEEVITNLVPLSEASLDEFLEIPALTSFLTYEYGNDLKDILKVEYLKEEERRKKEEEKNLILELKRLRKKVEDSGLGMEEYILALEKRNRMLENDSQELVKAKIEIEELNKKIDNLKEEINLLNENIIKLNEEIENKIKEIALLNEVHKNEIDRLNNEWQNSLNLKQEEYENAVLELKDNLEKEKEELKAQYEVDLENATITIEEELNIKKEELESKVAELENEVLELKDREEELRESSKEERNNLNDEIMTLNKTLKEKTNEFEVKLKELENSYKSDLEEHINELNNKEKVLDSETKKALYERNLMAAELRAIRVKHELLTPSEEYTSKERFLELESEFEAFNKFFKAQWDLTKKAIRKEILWKKPEKKNTKINDGGLSSSASSKLEEEKNEDGNLEENNIEETKEDNSNL